MLQVLATDADDAVNSNNGIVSYSILSQVPEEPQPGMFTIDSSSGLISVAKLGLVAEVSPGLSPHQTHLPLLADTASCPQLVPEYTLEIQAADQEGYGLQNTATVRITVQVRPWAPPVPRQCTRAG